MKLRHHRLYPVGTIFIATWDFDPVIEVGYNQSSHVEAIGVWPEDSVADYEPYQGADGPCWASGDMTDFTVKADWVVRSGTPEHDQLETLRALRDLRGSLGIPDHILTLIDQLTKGASTCAIEALTRTS